MRKGVMMRCEVRNAGNGAVRRGRRRDDNAGVPMAILNKPQRGGEGSRIHPEEGDGPAQTRVAKRPMKAPRRVEG